MLNSLQRIQDDVPDCISEALGIDLIMFEFTAKTFSVTHILSQI